MRRRRSSRPSGRRLLLFRCRIFIWSTRRPHRRSHAPPARGGNLNGHFYLNEAETQAAPSGATLTLVPDGESGGRPGSVGGQFDEEEPGGAEQPLVGKILHLVGVVQGGCGGVPVPDQQPGRDKQKFITGNVSRNAGSQLERPN